MKFREIAPTIVGIFTAIGLSIGLAAQTQINTPPPTSYTPLQLQRGGPEANVNAFARLISSQRVMAGSVDTADFNPNFPNSNGLIGLNTHVKHAAVRQVSGTVDLGALPGGDNTSLGLWISPSGTVAGMSETGSIDPLIGVPQAVAVIWRNGQITNLGTLGGNESIAIAVNSSDVAVGCAANTVPDDNSAFGWGTQTRAFSYSNGVMTDIGTLGGTDACATMNNDAGQIAGFSYTADGGFNPFFYQNGQMTDIGNLGGTFGFPNAISNTGYVVGGSNLAGDAIQHAYLWDGQIHDLGSLNSNPPVDYSQAIWVNDAGHVVGESNAAFNATHAVLWRNGTITDLGTLPGDQCSTAWGINNHDQVVGASGRCGFPQHAFLWQNGTMYDLSGIAPLRGVMTSAFFIDDAGNIATLDSTGAGGNGANFYTNAQHAFLLLNAGGGTLADGAASQKSDAAQSVAKRVTERYARAAAKK